MWAIKLINLSSHVQNRCSINPLCLQWRGERPLFTVLQRWHCSGVLCRPPGPPSGAFAALSFIINNNRPPGLPVLPGSLRFNDPSDARLHSLLIPGNGADGTGYGVTAGSDRWLRVGAHCWHAENMGQCCKKVRIKALAWLSKFFQKNKKTNPKIPRLPMKSRTQFPTGEPPLLSSGTLREEEKGSGFWQQQFCELGLGSPSKLFTLGHLGTWREQRCWSYSPLCPESIVPFFCS